MSLLLEFVDAHSWALLPSMLALLGLSAFAGKLAWGRRVRHEATADDELKVVLGATLSLFGLLIGFLLSFAIGGYNTRMAAEENEAIAIGNAFQRTTLLGAERQAHAERLLGDYLEQRIGFFDAPDETRREQARMQSIQMQTRMWAYVGRIAQERPDPVIVTVLNACNDLYTAQQKTMASWRHQIPGAAWAMLIAFGVCSNVLIGYNIRGARTGSALLLVVPAVTALAMFLIAEIDVPGRGLIHVTPDNLEAIRATLAAGGLAP
ncbi:hypothetical protein [Stenotrophomonas mori]|uniref:DUF4239 domain-containing protein n=1 Tax=Stenotrophomonas mori TaxID=2871096 RepID=A0ABT0SE11_9GAMM|nr:hypothetical protein [Stenotrophomonas mori]MCL7713346.1 hypothetical protein [Stenotrophomonas mori]